MSHVYSAINKQNGNEVTMLYNEKANHYVVVSKGNGVISYTTESIGDAYREYNALLR